MTTFDRATLRDLRKTMLAEMEAIAQKYGYTAEFGNIRFSEYEFKVKMTVKSKEASVPAVSNHPRKGKIAIGTKIYHPARKDPLTVTNISDRGSVFVVSARGAKYRLKMEDALKYAA